MNGRRFRHLPTAIGVVLLLSMVVHLWTAGTAEMGPLHVLGIVLTIGGSGAGMLVMGSRYVELPTPETGRTRLGVWMSASVVLFLGVGVVTVFLGSEEVTTVELLEILHVNGSVGMFVGLVMGVLESRSLASAEDAAREAARADALRDERERISNLNDLLRHYVLNGVAIVDGFAATIADRSPEHEAEVATIRHRADSMAVLVENVRALTVEAAPGTEKRVTTVERSLTRAVERRDDESIELSVPEQSVEIEVGDTFVDGISLLVDTVRRIVHEDGAVDIDCEVGPETVVVTVAGAPGALSEPLRESAFEPVTAGVGLQLYLVSELVGTYGEIAVVDTGADSERVAFEIELPRRDGPAERSATG